MNDLDPQGIIDVTTLDRITTVLQLWDIAAPDDVRAEVIGDLHRIRIMLVHNSTVICVEGETDRVITTRVLRLLDELTGLEKTSLERVITRCITRSCRCRPLPRPRPRGCTGRNNANNFNAVDISLSAAVTVFAGEIYRAPRSWAERAYHDLMYFNEVDKGGHFAA